MDADQVSGMEIISRQRLWLKLSLPYGLLLLASFISAIWRVLELPGIVGSLTPISVLPLAAAVAMAMYALRQRLPLGLLTWLPAGQGAVVLLSTGFVSQATTPEGADVFILGFVVMFLLVMVVSMLLAVHGVSVAVIYVSMFAMTQAVRSPFFDASATFEAGGFALATLIALVRATLEIGVLTWLVLLLVERDAEDGKSIAWAVVLLVVGHGLLAGWERPVALGLLSPGTWIGEAILWWILAGVQLGLVIGLSKVRRFWIRDTFDGFEQPDVPRPPPTPQRLSIPEESPEAEMPVYQEEEHPYSRSRPTAPRRRRRR